MAPFFANNSCSPWSGTGAGCSTGPLVRFTVNATDASHVQSTLAFAQKHNLRLTIRNTRHDYLGKSRSPGALAVWTRYMRDIAFHDYTSKSYTGSAVTIGVGVYNQEVNEVARERGLIVVGGNCGTIAVAGGFTRGGGHSPLTSTHGMAADQVLEWKVVAATGKVLVATPEHNSDLYWALSGGGGGTYGVVLSATLKAHPDIPTSGSTLSFMSDSTDSFWGVVKTYLKQMPNVVDSGAVAYFMIMGNIFMANPTIAPGLNQKDADRLMEPVRQHLDKEGIQYSYKSTSEPKYWDAWRELFVSNNVSKAQMGSRLLPRTLITENVTSVIQAYKTIVSKGALVVGIGANPKKRSSIDNAVLPAWRESLVHTVVGTLWSEDGWDQNVAYQHMMTKEILPELERLTPGGGAYLKEADAFQPDFQGTFFGSNYGRLRKIKAKYDPNDIFYAITAVGSEDWHQTKEGRLCRTKSRVKEDL